MTEEEWQPIREKLKNIRSGAVNSSGTAKTPSLMETFLNEIDPRRESVVPPEIQSEEWETSGMRVVEWNKEQTEHLKKRLGWEKDHEATPPNQS